MNLLRGCPRGQQAAIHWFGAELVRSGYRYTPARSVVVGIGQGTVYGVPSHE